jgi:hypothetical protein
MMRYRQGSFTPDDAVYLGKDAGDELKAQAGPDFFLW